MDLYSQLNAINQSPERVRGRQMRRARRQALVHDQIPSALGSTRAREAAVQWALYSKTDPTEGMGRPIGSNHPAQIATMAVREALSEFNMPTEYQVRWVGTDRQAGRGPHQITDGVITVEVGLHSMSGVDRWVDVPVMVHNGHVLEPACIVDRGVVRAMTQSTFDDLFSQGTFMTQVPMRETMFSPPPQERRPPPEVPLVRPGLFGLSPINKQLTAAYIKSAVSGHYVAELPDIADARAMTAMRDDAPEHLDRGEMPPPSIAAGDAIKLSRAVDIVGRDGQRWHLTAGTEGQVQRDMEGDGRSYYVFFPELGFSAKIGADALR